jgi:hypothetical protein
LIRVDSQIWDADLRKKARLMKPYKPEDFGLEPYLALNPNDDLTQAHLKKGLKQRK